MSTENNEETTGYTGFIDEGREWIEEERWSEDNAQFQKDKDELIVALKEVIAEYQTVRESCGYMITSTVAINNAQAVLDKALKP